MIALLFVLNVACFLVNAMRWGSGGPTHSGILMVINGTLAAVLFPLMVGL